MGFEWDERKRRANLKKHGFDFEDAEQVFAGVIVTYADEREDYGEARFITLGLLDNLVVYIVHTERGDNIRIISLRKALSYETDFFYQKIGYRLEPGEGAD